MRHEHGSCGDLREHVAGKSQKLLSATRGRARAYAQPVRKTFGVKSTAGWRPELCPAAARACVERRRGTTEEADARRAEIDPAVEGVQIKPVGGNQGGS
jgi:hypothetical protein